jgi:hypothetical protein
MLSQVQSGRSKGPVEGCLFRWFRGGPWHAGFVCYHVNVDGSEVLRRTGRQGSVVTGSSQIWLLSSSIGTIGAVPQPGV